MEIIIKLTSILFGLIIGFLAYKISGRSEVAGLLSILVGLLGTLVVNNLVEFYQQSRLLHRINTNLAELLTKVGKFYHSAWDLHQILRFGVTTFKREQIPNVWIELLWQMENKYCGVSYSDPNLWWSQAFSKLASEIQKTKIIVNKADIKRVFIYHDEAEKARIQDLMREQQLAGIQVKYIAKQSIEDNYLLKQLSGKIETFDFALIDGKMAWLVVVDKNRKFKAGKALVDDTLMKDYQSFFDHLFAEAAPFEG